MQSSPNGIAASADASAASGVRLRAIQTAQRIALAHEADAPDLASRRSEQHARCQRARPEARNRPGSPKKLETCRVEHERRQVRELRRRPLRDASKLRPIRDLDAGHEAD